MKRVLEDKRNVVLFVIGFICILAIIIAISYAFIAYYARQSEVNIVGTDCIKIEMKEKTNAITLESAIPLSDEDGYNTRPYIFEITNTCGVGINYNVNLEVLTQQGVDKQSIPNLIKSKNIATKIDNLEVKTLTEEIKNENVTYDEDDYKATESYTMYSGLLNPGETKSHSVRIWLHSSAGNETQNKVFYSKVIIEGIQNTLASINFNEYIMNKSEVERITHEATDQTPSLTDYRYTGSNPDNYVYFGCEGNECTEDNLYRIIGVIPTQSSDTSSYKNRVKLIKANYYTENESGLLLQASDRYPSPGGYGYQWNSTNTNKWEESTLQKNVLNGVYWNSLGEYQEYIEQAKWYLGAPNYNNYQTYTSDEFYKEERSNKQGYSKSVTSYVNNIGLMYPSDYGYSVKNSESSINNNRDNYKANAWLYNLENLSFEWLISPEKENSDYRAWHISRAGDIYYYPTNSMSGIWGIRPTFYLSEDVIYVGGTGTIGDPYRIGKEKKTFSDYIIAERQNDSSIEQVVHESTIQTGLDASIDYRYTGKNPNNYVCFGSEVSPCPSDNLYRIIGVIPTQSSETGPYENRVKLIKNDHYIETSSGYLENGGNAPGGKGYRWNKDAANNQWESTALNTKVLNEVYWNSLGDYQKFIEQAKWYLGAPDLNNLQIYTSEQFYTIERSTTQGYSKGAVSFIGNIGLMYPSDYGYSSNKIYWDQSISANQTNYVNEAWLYKLVSGNHEWTITPEETSSASFIIHSPGRPFQSSVNQATQIMGIRPTFYLKANVLYAKGDGTVSNPYRISL